jgi:hypothetical protein
LILEPAQECLINQIQQAILQTLLIFKPQTNKYIIKALDSVDYGKPFLEGINTMSGQTYRTSILRVLVVFDLARAAVSSKGIFPWLKQSLCDPMANLIPIN